MSEKKEIRKKQENSTKGEIKKGKKPANED
jgi:hypothetical protein